MRYRKVDVGGRRKVRVNHISNYLVRQLIENDGHILRGPAFLPSGQYYEKAADDKALEQLREIAARRGI